ncbi:MAG: sigma-70 family RNA polymerase sigma factor [Lachnospiraceae bacterium]|nr:sigma-70 family RNA polymerase sigma factor [Lachnospiraceae bacterium]
MRDEDYAYMAKLVEASQRDDSDAFAELYALTYNKVYNYCRHYLRNAFAAQDAVQEIYVTALTNIRKLNDPTLFVAWLNQISFRTCYDMTRRKNPGYDMPGTSVFDFLEDEIHEDIDPERTAVRKMETERLRRAIDQLDFRDKQIIILRYYNNMKLPEIASATGASLSTVKRHLLSAQDKLRSLMDEGRS